jgi:hypothetical protein
LESVPKLDAVVSALPMSLQRALAAIEARGGELEWSELLDIVREPARFHPDHVAPKNGPAFTLLSRALVLPRAGGVYTLPSEVALRVGRERRALASRSRAALVAKLALADEDPLRAEHGSEPSLAVAALLANLQFAGELSDGAPIRTTALSVAAKSVNVPPERAVAWAALGKASVHSTPIGNLGSSVIELWRASGVWDEALVEPERARARPEVRALSTPTAAVREALLGLMLELPKERFARRADLVRGVFSDLRTDSADTTLARARKRAPKAFVDSRARILERIFETLAHLGALDQSGEYVRLASWARRALAKERARATPSDSPRWLDERRVALPGNTPLGTLVSIAPLGASSFDAGHVVLEVSEESAPPHERGLAGSILLELAPATEATRALLAKTDRRPVTCESFATSTFMVVPDSELLERLRADTALAKWVAFWSRDGIAFRADAPTRRVEERLRAMGVTRVGDLGKEPETRPKRGA